MKIKGKVAAIPPHGVIIGKKDPSKEYYKYYVVIDVFGADQTQIAMEQFLLEKDAMPSLRIGETVEVDIAIESREHKDKWYTNVKMKSYSIISEQVVHEDLVDNNVTVEDTGTVDTNDLLF